MSWNDLPPTTRAQAEQVLTKKQLDVLILHLAGCGTRPIATMLGLSRTTTRDHLTIALTTLANLTREAA